jgi:hypothetical protein
VGLLAVLVAVLACLPSAATASAAATAARAGTLQAGVVVAGSAATAVRADAVVRKVPRAQWRRIVAVGAWRPGCPVRRAGLRRVEVNHHGFDGQVHRGVLVVNRDVARSVAGIFTQLFDTRFPIRQIRPIEDFRGNDNKSMRADNTSAYNCRRPGQANASARNSPHANGRAVDVNPYENPWIDPRCDCWRPSATYAERRAAPGVIVKRGTAWRIFRRAGWIWQNSRTKDYQHFDTGYPSRRRDLP